MFMDAPLARRLERTEGAVASSFVAVRQRRAPEVRAEWRDVQGTYALFDGGDSPMTQTFGLGMFAPATAAQLDELEAFFGERGADTMHEVSPLAGVETSALLATRGYVPIEHSTVLVRDLADAPAPPSRVQVRILDARDAAARATWVDTSVAGWIEDPAYAPLMRSIAETSSENAAMVHFLAELDGQPVGTASLGVHEGIALFAGASTVPAARGQGAQAVLLAARFDEARRRGCELAQMITAPGSTSQRNAERRGFRVAYSRTKWRRDRQGSQDIPLRGPTHGTQRA